MPLTRIVLHQGAIFRVVCFGPEGVEGVSAVLRFLEAMQADTLQRFRAMVRRFGKHGKIENGELIVTIHPSGMYEFRPGRGYWVRGFTASQDLVLTHAGMEGDGSLRPSVRDLVRMRGDYQQN